jgi:hypothetical protein
MAFLIQVYVSGLRYHSKILTLVNTQLPLIAVSGILVAFTVKIPVKEKTISKIKRVDFLGSITLVLTLVSLLLGLNSGGNVVPWTHPLVLTTLPLSGFFLLLFIYIEDKIALEPIIPVRLLLHRTVACACLTNWFITMSTFILFYYVPIYFQVLGYSTTQAGIRIIPVSIGASIGSLSVGWIMQATGKYYILNIFIQALTLVSFSLIATTFNRTLATIPPFVYFFMAGAGYGGMLTVTLLALIAAVDHKNQAVITSASYAFRSTGSAIGITIASTVFQNILKAELWRHFGHEPHAGKLITRLRDSVDEVQHLPPKYYEGAMESYMWAFKGVWCTMLGLGVIGVLISLGMREHVLHKTLTRQ